MRPLAALMVPEFATDGATKAASPAPATVIVPALDTEPAVAPEMANEAVLPDMKSVTLMLPVEAIRPPTFTLAVGPNSTPFGLRIITCPLAPRMPSIMLWPPAKPMRLTATELAPGWVKFTEAPLPMLNVDQSMTARCEVWFTTIELAVGVVIKAAPAVMVPPVGSACAFAPPASALATANALAFILNFRVDLMLPPRLETHHHRSKNPDTLAVPGCHVARHRPGQRPRCFERCTHAPSQRRTRAKTRRSEARAGAVLRPHLAAVPETVELVARQPLAADESEIGRLHARSEGTVADQLGGLVGAAEAPAAQGELLG